MKANLATLLASRLEQPPRVMYRQFAEGAWRDYTAHDVAQQAARWQATLRRAGLQPGERVGLCLRNGVQWVAADMAALGLGLAVVPFYVDDNPGNIAFCARDSGCRVLVLENQRLLAGLLDASLTGCELVVLHGEAPPGVQSAQRWLQPDSGAAFEARDLAPGTLASIVYTSGTSGRPKGVMLSHRNILFDVQAGLQTITLGADERFISLLPLSHMLERTVGYYLPLLHGASVVYSRGISQFADDLATQQPTAMITVPRVLERLYQRMLQALRQQPLRARALELAAQASWMRCASSRRPTAR